MLGLLRTLGSRKTSGRACTCYPLVYTLGVVPIYVGRREWLTASFTESFIRFSCSLGALNSRIASSSLSSDKLPRLRRRPRSGVDCSAQCIASSSTPYARPTSCGSSLASLSKGLRFIFSRSFGITGTCGRPYMLGYYSTRFDMLGAATVFGRLERRWRTFFFSIRSSRW